MEEAVVEAFVPSHMTKWETPQYYYGEEPVEWYVVLSRTRDSGLLEESNFECMLKALGGENTAAMEEMKGAYIAHHSHWACGWVEHIMLHQSDTALLKVADEIKDRLEDYPVVDENDYSERCLKEQEENVEQAVKDWVNDTDPEITDDEQEHMQYLLCQEANDDSHWPDADEIADVYERVHGHLWKCPIHWWFLDTDPCECQLRMNLPPKDLRPWWKRVLHLN